MKDKHSKDCTMLADDVLIPISLAFAPTANTQHYMEMQVKQGTTILQALHQSGLLADYAELAGWCQQYAQAAEPNNKQWYVGIFSFKQPLNYVLQAYDRIEIYRSLTQDPMRKRQARAKNESK